jgi:hypothetical protein
LKKTIREEYQYKTYIGESTLIVHHKKKKGKLEIRLSNGKGSVTGEGMINKHFIIPMQMNWHKRNNYRHMN